MAISGANFVLHVCMSDLWLDYLNIWAVTDGVFCQLPCISVFFEEIGNNSINNVNWIKIITLLLKNKNPT